MAQIKGSIVVLLLLGIVVVGVYAAGDGKLPWPPPPILPPDMAEDPPPPSKQPALPRIVDRPVDTQVLPGQPPAPGLPNGPRYTPNGQMPQNRLSPNPLMVDPLTAPTSASVLPAQRTSYPEAPKTTAAPMPPSNLVSVETIPAPPTDLPSSQAQMMPPFPKADTKEAGPQPLPPFPRVTAETAPLPLPQTSSTQPTAPPTALPSPMVTNTQPATLPMPGLPPPAVVPVPKMQPPQVLPPAVPNVQPPQVLPPAVPNVQPPQVLPPAVPNVQPPQVLPPVLVPMPNVSPPQAPPPALVPMPNVSPPQGPPPAVDPVPNIQPLQAAPLSQMPGVPALLPEASKVPALPLEQPAPRFTPAAPNDNRSFAPSFENAMPMPAPVEVPSSQPKRLSSFRVLGDPPQESDAPLNQGSFTPTGPVVATSSANANPPTMPSYQNSPPYSNYQNPPPLPSYPNPQPLGRPEPSYQNQLPQDVPNNNTPVQAEMLPPNSIKAGELATYQIVLRNPTRVAASNVQLEVEIQGLRLERASSMPKVNNGKLMWTFPSFPARSQIKVVMITRVTSQSPQVSMDVTGPPAASESGQARPPQLSSAPAISGVNLTMGISGPASAEVNQPVTFAIRVVNTGTQPIVDPIFYLSLPAGLRNVGGSDRARFKTLPPGGETTFRVQVAGNAPGRHTLHCWVNMANVRLSTAAASIAIGQPGLQIIQHPTTSLRTGQGNEIRFQVVNNSAQELQHVGVTSNLPDGLHLIYASDRGNYHDKSREVTWLIDLQPNEARVLSMQVEPDQAGQWTHQVRAVCGIAPEVASAAQLRADGASNLH